MWYLILGGLVIAGGAFLTGCGMVAGQASVNVDGVELSAGSDQKGGVDVSASYDGVTVTADLGGKNPAPATQPSK